MTEKVLITAGLPYANGPLHFGHIAGAYLPADCYARFQRLIGNDVLFICGSDEYGIATTLSAEIAKRTPQQHVDLFHGINSQFFQKLEISFDHYSRTTWEGHIKPTQEFFLDLLKNGHIEEKVTDQLYSPEDKRFLADRYVIGTCPKCKYSEARGDECPKCAASYEATDLINPRSKITGKSLILKPTKHWFLRFDHFKEQLSKWISKKNWKSNVVNFAKHYIDDLKPRAITRDMEWGIPVPLEGAEGKVLYVWFDAPIGYISATKEWAEKKKDPTAWEKYWLDDKTKYVQFIGKDNIPFHAIFFPAMVMGQDKPYKLVDELPANEFLNLEGKQFSKSAKWYIDLEDFFKHFTAEQIRYTLAANSPETHDSEFTWKDFEMRCNAELVGKYGNLVNRVLVFITNQAGRTIPKMDQLHEIDQEFIDQVDGYVQEAKLAYGSYHLRKAAKIVMDLASCGNVYFDAKKPWQLAKEPASKNEMLHTLACCIYCLKALALISYPIIPKTAEKLWRLIGYKTALHQMQWDKASSAKISEGEVIPEVKPLFKKIEDKLIEKKINELKEKPETNTQITFEDFKKIDFRVAEILAAEPVPKSKKLIQLGVSIGDEKRTIVSGIGDSIDDVSSLIGKKVVVVANLKPAKLMGVESQGMLLAADCDDGLEVIFLNEAKSGACVS